MKIGSDGLPDPTFQELENSAASRPQFNKGQKVIWLTGPAYNRGQVVTITRISGEDGRWFIEVNGQGASFPGRVAAMDIEDSTPAEPMREVEE